jgi:hypothetical protein
MTLLANAFTDPFVDAWEVIKDVLFSTQGFLLIGLIVFIYGMSLLADKKSKLTSGRFAGGAEKLKAVGRALKQLKSSDADEVVLWCGTPPQWMSNGLIARLMTMISGKPPTVYVPRCQP